MNNKTRHITPPPTNRASQDSLTSDNPSLDYFLTNPFSLESFKSWVDTTFLGDTNTLIAPKDYSNKLPDNMKSFFKSCHCVANTKQIPKEEGSEYVAKLAFFAFELSSNTIQAKLSIHRALFDFAKKIAAPAILACFYTPDSEEFRLSLITLGYDPKERKILSNDLRRQSFVLGQGASIHCALKQLCKLHPQSTLSSLKKAFSIEPITEEFYKKILEHYESFHSQIIFPKTLKSLPLQDKDKSPFILRLISRILFCKFLEKKLVQIGVELSKLWKLDELDSDASTDTSTSYYSYILEPLFYQTLNTPQKERNYSFVASKATAHLLAPKELQELLDSIPYLNGGLFEPQDTDFYRDGRLSIPDGLFKELFDTLEHYHFTIDESTPSNQEVGLDPEMLGMVFERLLGTLCDDAGSVRTPDALSKQKTTGSYYTPREIVSYMCKSTLLAYLTHKLTSSQQGDSVATAPRDKSDQESKPTLESSIKNLIFHIEPLPTEHSDHIKTILAALSDFKVLDPACGSGAFPIGMLQEICQILETLDPEASHFLPLQPKDFQNKIQAKKSTPSYIFKLAILQNCIYGVDIQPMATEISRLRCFLSLIVDETILEPLPNLEFKFLTANSLMPYNPCDTLKYDKYEQHVKELEDIRAQTFTTGAPKKSLQESFLSLISEMASRIREAGMVDSTPLTEWNPYDPQSQAKFFNSNFMFGVEKFDCVIGNPPYVRSGRLGSQKALLLPHYQSVANKSADLYVYFFGLGYEILKDGGLLSYITSNKYTRAGYGKHLRTFLLKNTQILSYIDFNGVKVFESASVDTSIMTFAKTSPSSSHYLSYLSCQDKSTLKDATHFTPLAQSNLSAESFSFASQDALALKAKIESTGTPLKEWDIAIGYGVKTGRDNIFIISTAKREEILANCKDEDERQRTRQIVKKTIRGADIRSYQYTWRGEWLICTFPALKLDIEDYPALKAYLESFRPRIEPIGTENGGRKKGSYKWFETQDNIAYHEDFEKEKIVYPCIMAKESRFAYDNDAMYAVAPANIITGERKQLLFIQSLLNSKLIYFAMRKFYMGGGIEGELKTNNLQKIPVPKIDSTNQGIADKIIALVEEILEKKKQDSATDTTALESQINKLVYTLYNLIDEEIELIEKG